MTALQPGMIFERRYRIVEELGRGSFATVYLAEHVDVGHYVAIKLLQRASADERFVREAAILAELSSPHTIRLLDFGRIDAGDAPYMIFEYVEGEALDTYLDRTGALDWETAASIVRQVLTSLSEANAHGVVHRDIKPANAMITGEGVVKVLDFGIAKVLSESPGARDELTLAGATMGTPYYMAPELVSDAASAGPTADVFSVGVMAWELLTGRHLQEGLTIRDIFARHVTDEIYEVPHDVDVPYPLRSWVESLLRKDPALRPPDAGVALEGLDGALERIEAEQSGSLAALRSQVVQGAVVDSAGRAVHRATVDTFMSEPHRDAAPRSHVPRSGRSLDASGARDWYMIAFATFVLGPAVCLISSVVLVDDVGLSVSVGLPLAVLAVGVALVVASSFTHADAPDPEQARADLVRWLSPLVLLSFAWTAILANLAHVLWLVAPLVATFVVVVIRRTSVQRARSRWSVEIVVSLLAAAAGAVVMLNGFRAHQAIEEATDEGAMIGREAGSRVCLPGVMERHASCAGSTCSDENHAFFQACLEHSANPMAVCDPLPSTFRYRSAAGWGAAVCDQQRRANDPDCARLVARALYPHCKWGHYDPDAPLLDF